MEILAVITGHLLVPALIVAAGRFVLRLLPLVSNSVNTRAVRLAEAKKGSDLQGNSGWR